jgi:arylsulfatase A-like enzyme
VIPDAFGAWLDANPARPFFAYLNYMEAHLPRIPSLEARTAVMDPGVLTRSLQVSQRHVDLLAAMFGVNDYDAEELRAIRQVYDAALRDLDAATAKLIQALERRGVLEDTIVVITSDHGENVGDHGLFDHKYTLRDTLIHVPLVVRYPRAVPVGRVRETVGVADVFATVLDLAALPVEASVPSRSLLSPRRSAAPIFSELLVSTPNALMKVEKVYGSFDWKPWLWTYRSVEWQGYKAIRASNGTRELFHVARDPGERADLAAREPGRVAALERELDRWLERTDPYDPSAASPEDGGKPLQKEVLERLEALGYVN